MKRKRKRLRRQDAARTAPIRKFSTLLRPAANSLPPSQPESEAAEDPVGEAVRVGYSVVEEQIRRGEAAARRIGGVAGTGMLQPDAGALMNRLLRYSTDLAALYFDLISLLARPPAAHGSSADGHATGGAGTSLNGKEQRRAVAIEIVSKRKNQVTLDLWANAANGPLAVPPLHSLDADKAPVTDVQFLPGAQGEPLRLRIVIPDSQPADVYTGLIMNRETRESSGTLSLRLFD